MAKNDIIIFRSTAHKHNGLMISFAINMKKYSALRFTIYAGTAAKYDIEVGNKVVLAIDKDDINVWYLLLNNYGGHKIRKQKSSNNLYLSLTNPFIHIPRIKDYIPQGDIQYVGEKDALKFSVEKMFKHKPLKLKEINRI